MKYFLLLCGLWLLQTGSTAQTAPNWYYGQLQTPNFRSDLSSDLVVTPDGTTYLAHVGQSPNKRDVLLHKIAPDGRVLWSKRYLNPTLSYIDQVRAGLLPDGSVAIAWSSSFPDYGGLFRTDSAGVPIWSFRFPESPTIINGLQVVGDRCVLAGESRRQPLAAMVALDGQLQWAHLTTDTLLPAQRLSAWYSVTAMPSGQLLFTGRLSTYDANTHTVGNQSLIGQSDMDGHFAHYQKGTPAHLLFAQPTPTGEWYLGGNQLAQYEGGIVVHTDSNFLVLEATAFTQPSGALLGMLSLPDPPSVLVSLSGPLYGLGTYKAFNWGYLNTQGQVTGTRAIPAASNSTRMAMDNWKLAPNGDLVASGIQERTGKPSETLLLHLPAQATFPDCCAEKDSLHTEHIPFAFTTYAPGSTNLSQWLPLPLEMQSIAPAVAQFPCQMTRFELNSPDTLICPGECLTVSVTNNNGAPTLLQWMVNGTVDTTLSGPGPHLICFGGMGNQAITVSTMETCPAVEITRSIHIRPVTTPNAFTPNGDGTNDRFAPLFYCESPDYLFQIYGRWGELLFETDDPLYAWDGRVLGQDAPVDTYVWTLHYAGMHLRGEVTLIR